MKDDREPRIYLHIGYHKTGTTYLQSDISPNLGIDYLGKPWCDDRIMEFMKEFYSTHDLDFEPSKLRRKFWDYVRERDTRQPVLISSEGLHAGIDWFGRDVVSMIHRIYAVFYPCNIILGIRSQKTYLVSFYKEYVREGGTLSFADFLGNSTVGTLSVVPSLQYDKVIRILHETFGKDSVFVYLQEQLAAKPRETVNKMCEWMQIQPPATVRMGKRYASFSKATTEILRWVNILTRSEFSALHSHGFLAAIRNRLIPLCYLTTKNLPKGSYEISDTLVKSYTSSNKQLGQILGLDVKKWGYD